MDKLLAVHKKTVTITEDNQVYTFSATCSIKHLQGNQHPYFAITGELKKDYRLESCGCLHDYVKAHIPEFSPFLKWHLTDFTGTPMHYIANSLYWAGKLSWCNGKQNDPPNIEYFKSICVYGVSSLDNLSDEDILSMSKEDLTAWLTKRLPEVQNSFMSDMLSLFPGQLTLK